MAFSHILVTIHVEIAFKVSGTLSLSLSLIYATGLKWIR